MLIVLQKLSYRLYQAGYRHILNVDFSETVISRMSARYSADCPEMEWKVMILSFQLVHGGDKWPPKKVIALMTPQVMDVRELEIDSSSIDVAIDKV